MLQKLMWIEVALKLGSGVILGLFSVTSPRLFGLPPTTGTFWQRLLAAVLVGIGLATILQATITPGRGIGLAGLMAINLVAAAVATGQLVMGTITTRRGKATLWALVLTLTGLSLVELAHI